MGATGAANMSRAAGVRSATGLWKTCGGEVGAEDDLPSLEFHPNWFCLYDESLTIANSSVVIKDKKNRFYKAYFVDVALCNSQVSGNLFIYLFFFSKRF